MIPTMMNDDTDDDDHDDDVNDEAEESSYPWRKAEWVFVRRKRLASTFSSESFSALHGCVDLDLADTLTLTFTQIGQ
jgi:hypothetical protein